MTDKLSIANLEAAAKHLADVCTSLPAKVKQPRKKPIARCVLLAKIAERDRTINQLLAEKEALEQELAALRVERARWIVKTRERQI